MTTKLPAVQAVQLPAMPNDFESIRSLGQVLFDSGFYTDTRSASQAVVKVLAGRELGFGPVAAMTGVHVIEGRPSVGAHLMASLIKRSGKYDYRVIRLDREACELEFFELVGAKRESVGKVAVTLQDFVASGAALAKDGKSLKANWRTNPDDMLFARSISKGYRRYCPDLTGGVVMYTPDELDAPAGACEVIDASYTANGVHVSDTPAAPPPPAAPEIARITEEQHAELGALIRDTKTDARKLLDHYRIKVLKQLPSSEFAAVRAHLQKRLADQQEPASPVLAPHPPTTPTACVTVDQAAKLRQLAADHKVNERDCLEFVGVPVWGAVPAAAFTWLRLQLERGFDPHALPVVLQVKTLTELHPDRLDSMTKACLSEKIDHLVIELKVSAADWNTRMQSLYGHTDSTRLSVANMLELEGRLTAYKQKLASQGSAA